MLKTLNHFIFAEQAQRHWNRFRFGQKLCRIRPWQHGSSRKENQRRSSRPQHNGGTTNKTFT